MTIFDNLLLYGSYPIKFNDKPRQFCYKTGAGLYVVLEYDEAGLFVSDLPKGGESSLVFTEPQQLPDGFSLAARGSVIYDNTGDGMIIENKIDHISGVNVRNVINDQGEILSVKLSYPSQILPFPVWSLCADRGGERKCELNNLEKYVFYSDGGLVDNHVKVDKLDLKSTRIDFEESFKNVLRLMSAYNTVSEALRLVGDFYDAPKGIRTEKESDLERIGEKALGTINCLVFFK